MKFINLILKNIFRNKSRTFLALLGISIGIAAIVGLGLVTDGLTASTEKTLTAGAADFTLTSASSAGGQGGQGGPDSATMSQNSSSGGTINQTRVEDVLKITGVEDAAGALQSSFTINGSQMPVNAIGIDGTKLSLADAVITNGSTYSTGNEVIIGTTASKNMNKTVGDTLSISNQTFKIVGIYETGNFMEDGGVFMSLSSLQNITNSTGTISSIMVKANNTQDSDNLITKIESAYPDLSNTKSLASMGRMNNGLETISTGAWAISLLAALISGVIVLIIMIKSVVERTREIGVLKSVGWTNKRVMTMILGESVIITVMASIVGLLIGVGAVELLSISNLIPNIQLAFSAELFLKAIGVALLLGILGGLYPAYRASKLSPTEALRYE
jgi:putative ABC transport system permease protein